MPLTLIPASTARPPAGAPGTSASGGAPWPGDCRPQPSHATITVPGSGGDVSQRYSPLRTLHPAASSTAAGRPPLQLLIATRASDGPSTSGPPEARPPPAVDASLAAESMLVYPEGALGAFGGAAFGQLRQQTSTARGSVSADGGAAPPPRGLMLARPTGVRRGDTPSQLDAGATPCPPFPDSTRRQQDAAAAARPVQGAEQDAHSTVTSEATAALPGLRGDEPAQVPPAPPAHGLFFYTAPEVARIADAIRGGSHLNREKEAPAAPQPYMSRCCLSVIHGSSIDRTCELLGEECMQMRCLHAVADSMSPRACFKWHWLCDFTRVGPRSYSAAASSSKSGQSSPERSSSPAIEVLTSC